MHPLDPAELAASFRRLPTHTSTHTAHTHAAHTHDTREYLASHGTLAYRLGACVDAVCDALRSFVASEVNEREEADSRRWHAAWSGTPNEGGHWTHTNYRHVVPSLHVTRDLTRLVATSDVLAGNRTHGGTRRFKRAAANPMAHATIHAYLVDRIAPWHASLTIRDRLAILTHRRLLAATTRKVN